MPVTAFTRRELLCATTAFSLLMSAPLSAQEAPTIGVVVKLGGIPWSNAIEAGIKKRSGELGVNGFMVGPTSADPALQVRAIEDLIAQGVDVIGVIPNDTDVLEPVLKRAMDSGIKVITHESPGQQNLDWNFELASVEGFGEAYGKQLAELLGGEGKYAVFVGSLTVPLHNAWADAAIAYIKENHPDMEVVGDRYGVAESVDDSRKTALDLMRANPDLRGFLAFGSQGPIGAARAVDERRKGGEIVVLGPFSPGQGRSLVHKGVLTGGYMWNPEVSGEVFVTLGAMLANGDPIVSGTVIEGMGPVEPDVEGKDLIVDQLILIDEKSVDELAEMGL
ncbi:MAG: substrate-binding domain-containing protein [Tropicimonas sp.]|uniref:substrate-binding domain-containing protein n=1 Tax=Tropicimonas sp. TaxID=2067044 RepID=UPI003A84E138